MFQAAFDDAIAELDTLSEESYKDSTLIMQVMVTTSQAVKRKTTVSLCAIPLNFNKARKKVRSSGKTLNLSDSQNFLSKTDQISENYSLFSSACWGITTITIIISITTTMMTLMIIIIMVLLLINILFQLLRDNLTLWTSDMQGEGEEKPAEGELKPEDGKKSPGKLVENKGNCSVWWTWVTEPSAWLLIKRGAPRHIVLLTSTTIPSLANFFRGGAIGWGK